MSDPLDIALRINRLASDQLAGLKRHMAAMKWPDDMQAIVWRAVAGHAEKLAAEADTRAKA